MRIPFLDLSERTRVYRAALDDAYRSVMESGQFIQGPRLDSFESNFAAYCESKVCVGVGNGLDALSLILQAYEIGPGDEVIVPSNTYIATWLAISAVGATPVPVEPNPRTWNLDVAAMTAAMTQRSRAVIAVHLYGQFAEMRELRAFSTQHGIKLIEVSGLSPLVVVDPDRFRPVDLPLLRADNTRLLELGWQPSRSLDVALRDLWTATVSTVSSASVSGATSPTS